MTETTDKNTTRLQHAFGVVWSMATMAFWMFWFGMLSYMYIMTNGSGQPIILQSSVLLATCGGLLIAGRIQSKNYRIECVMFVTVCSILAQSKFNMGGSLGPTPVMAIAPIAMVLFVSVFSDGIVRYFVKGNTRLVGELILFVVSFIAIYKILWSFEFGFYFGRSSSRGPVDPIEKVLMYAVGFAFIVAAGVTQYARRNRVDPVGLPDLSPFLRLAKFLREGGLKVRIYIYVALFIAAAVSLIYVFLFNDGWHFI